MLYGICEDNFIKFERKISPILKKCEKYGVDFSYKIIGEEFRDTKQTELTRCKITA